MRASWCLIALFLSAPAQAAKVQEVVTPGGIRAWLAEEHSLPIVSVKIIFTDSGTATDPKGRQGRAAIAGDALLEGAGELDTSAFREALETDAIDLTVSTGDDHTTISLNALTDARGQAFSLLGLALTRPRMEEDSITRLKAETQARIRKLEQSPGYRLSRLWQEQAYGAHPYAQPAIGTHESVAALTPAQVAEYRERYLTRENMLIGVAGDIDPKTLSTLLDAHLSDLPKTYRPEAAITDTSPRTPDAPVIETRGIPQTLVSFGGSGIRRDDPRYLDAYVMNHILGGGGILVSRLGKAVREERGLAYYISSGLNPKRHAAEWGGTFATRNDAVGQSIEALKESLKEFRERGASEEELADAKKYLTGTFLLSLDSNADVADFLISMQLNNLGIDYLERRNRLIEAVTRQDVNTMAKRLIDPEKLLVVMVGQPEGLENETANQTAP